MMKLAVLVVLLTALSPAPSWAETISWCYDDPGGPIGNWHKAENWYPDKVPGPDDDVIIENGSAIELTGNVKVQNLTLRDTDMSMNDIDGSLTVSEILKIETVGKDTYFRLDGKLVINGILEIGTNCVIVRLNNDYHEIRNYGAIFNSGTIRGINNIYNYGTIENVWRIVIANDGRLCNYHVINNYIKKIAEPFRNEGKVYTNNKILYISGPGVVYPLLPVYPLDKYRDKIQLDKFRKLTTQWSTGGKMFLYDETDPETGSLTKNKLSSGKGSDGRRNIFGSAGVIIDKLFKEGSLQGYYSFHCDLYEAFYNKKFPDGMFEKFRPKPEQADSIILGSGLTFEIDFSSGEVKPPADIEEFLENFAITKIFPSGDALDLMKVLAPFLSQGVIAMGLANGKVTLTIVPAIMIVDGPAPEEAIRPLPDSPCGAIYDEELDLLVIFDGVLDGVIADPIAVMTKEAMDQLIAEQEKGRNKSSGGGCDAGFVTFGTLVLLGGLYLRKRRP